MRWLLLCWLACGPWTVPPLPSAHTPPPGGSPRSEATVTALSAAYRGLDDSYTPRTKHLTDTGEPRFTNRLIRENSPYLLQHAHNPVDWHPWGDEAFALAKELGKPILLSVGYSTCHWCHVMEEESFEDLEVAETLNRLYVPIKVDREQRPDVDAVYMAAVHAMRNRGGWPMTVWLTPDGKPFYAGTYFPARDGDRGRSTGFLTLLERMSEAYTQEPETVVARADEIATLLQRQLASSLTGPVKPEHLLTQVRDRTLRSHDTQWGGLQRTPKFPSSFPNRVLLYEYLRTGDPKVLDAVLLTLRRMARGGLHDLVGGGFHRYSTEKKWLVPHFEKMLYDNALLAVAYAEVAQTTGDHELREVARRTLDYVGREMTSPQGAFWSATDADSPVPGTDHREEGWFFTWTPDEVRAALPTASAEIVLSAYGITPRGNFEGRSIPFAARPLADIAQDRGMSEDEVRQRLERAREVLYALRATRPPPLLDDKVITAWNGLMISAHARVGHLLGDRATIDRGARAASFLLQNLVRDGRLLRTWRGGQAAHAAMLEDQAFLAAATLDLFEVTGDPRWLKETLARDRAIQQHYEAGDGGWFRTPSDSETLLARERPDHDGAEPTGTSVHVLTLLRLYALTSDVTYERRAWAALRAHGRMLERGALSEMLHAVRWAHVPPREIVLVAPTDLAQLEPFLAALRVRPPFDHVLVQTTAAQIDQLAPLVPIATDKEALGGQATAYVCQQGVCLQPATQVDAFLAQLTPAQSEAP